MSAKGSGEEKRNGLLKGSNLVGRERFEELRRIIKLVVSVKNKYTTAPYLYDSNVDDQRKRSTTDEGFPS